MKMQYGTKLARFLSTLLCVMCVLSAMPGTGTASIVNPAESDDLYLFAVEFSDTGITLMLPIPYTKSGMAVNEDDFKCMLALTDDFDNAPYFAITAIRNQAPLMPDPPQILGDEPPLYYMPLLYEIMSEFDFTKMVGEYTDDFGEDVPAIRITLKDDEAFGRHTIGVRDGWWMVLSLFPGVESAKMDRLEAYEEVIFQYMVTPYGFLPTVQTIALPGSSLILALPEDMQATVDRYDEYTDREWVVYLISSSKEDKRIILLSLVTVRKETYQGKRLQDLRRQELEEEVSEFLFGQGELESIWLHTNSDCPLLLLREVGTETAEHKNPDIYHLIVMKDGWLVNAQLIDIGTRPVRELLSMQMSFLMRMLAGDGEMPALEPETVFFDTLGGMIALDIPLGYSIEHMNPEEGADRYILGDLQVLGKAYDFTFNAADEANVGVTVDDHMESLRETAGMMEKNTGEAVTLERVEEGILGEPAIYISTESGSVCMIYFIKDGCMTIAGIQSKGTAITQEEIGRIPEMLRFLAAGDSN